MRRDLQFQPEQHDSQYQQRKAGHLHWEIRQPNEGKDKHNETERSRDKSMGGEYFDQNREHTQQKKEIRNGGIGQDGENLLAKVHLNG